MTETFVITCRVPCTDLDDLELTQADHTVAVRGPGGYRHELELPAEADMGRLEIELFKEFLEIRAPISVT
jgi:hypothetical protein